jgi:hypothetical protein
MWRGPRTSGTGGNFGLADGRAAGIRGETGAGVGAGAGLLGAVLQDALTIVTQHTKTLRLEAFIGEIEVAR